MAEPYLERLTQLVDRLELTRTGEVTLENKHFFSGAALYANGKICALLSPNGLAVKLPAHIRRSLIKASKGSEYRFFAEGPIKREYLALSESLIRDDKSFRDLLVTSVNYVAGLPGSDAVAKKE